MKYSILLGVLVISNACTMGAMAPESKKKSKKVVEIINHPIMPSLPVQSVTQSDLRNMLLRARL